MRNILKTVGILVLLGDLAAACARPPMPELALACQTRTCVCLPAEQSFPAREKSRDVLWHANGDAYCPEGYVLRLATDRKKTY